MASTERMRLKRQRDPDRKFRKLDSIYMFGEVEVSVIIDEDGSIWFKGVDLAKALELDDPNQSTIDRKYCKSFEELTADNIHTCHIPILHPKTTFINETGVNMFILKSRKPKTEAFVEWVCEVVLPSICRTNKYEIDPDDNPYKEMNKYLKEQVKNVEMEKTARQHEIQRTAPQNDLRKSHDKTSKCITQVFKMKPSCVPHLNKQEYFVLYRKYKPSSNFRLFDPMPYYRF